MDLNKRSGESELQYHKRLINGKLTDKTLSDIDYSELAEFVYGQPYSSDVARRMMYGSKKTLELIDRESIASLSDDISTGIDEQILELKKERQKFFDQRTALNKLIREQARHEELTEALSEALRLNQLPELNYTPRISFSSNNDLLCSLNDIHYGIDVNNAWNVYNPDVFCQMLRDYLNRIIEIATVHNSENCILFCNGDMISGNIHKTIQVSNKENVVRQIMGVSELLSEFIAELSKHFSCVQFVSVAGNHSRLDKKEDSPLDERLDDLVEWYLKARLDSFDNVIIGGAEKVDSTMYLIDIRGKTYLGVHGDYDNNISKITALQAMAGRNVYAILSGHFHHNRIDEVQGIKTVMAGSFVGMDDYCIQKRIYGKPEQLVCVCNDSGIACYYDVPLSR